MPIASIRSQPLAACSARRRSSGTRPWPNEIVADFRIPPHVRHGGSASPARTRASARSIGARWPHDRHVTSRAVPWISTTSEGDEPAFWCSPSTFCVSSARSFPVFSSVTRARWPSFGAAESAGDSSRLRHDRLADLGIGDVVVDRPPSSRPRGSASTRPAGRGSPECPNRSRCRRRSARRSPGLVDEAAAAARTRSRDASVDMAVHTTSAVVRPIVRATCGGRSSTSCARWTAASRASTSEPSPPRDASRGSRGAT